MVLICKCVNVTGVDRTIVANLLVAMKEEERVIDFFFKEKKENKKETVDLDESPTTTTPGTVSRLISTYYSIRETLW
jgi:hypothetical protein